MPLAQILAEVRDVAIIALACLNGLLILALLLMVVFIWRQFRRLTREMPDLIELVRQTLTRVEGTTDFVGNTVARPAIAAVSFGAALRRFLAILVRGPGRQEARR